MIEGSFIEDENVGQGGKDEVNDDAEEPGGEVLVNGSSIRNARLTM